MTKKNDLSPHEAAERFIQRRRSTNTANTVRSYRGRLQEFTQWTHANDITSMDELDGWLLDEYKAHLETADNAPATIKGKLNALKQLLQYCVTIEIVDENLPEKISIPQLSREDETSDTLLAAEDAVRLIEYFRNSTREYATRHHVTLELMWHIGGRISCFRALDVQDWHPEDRTLEFRHRPTTRLKVGTHHERNVLVSEPVADVVSY